MDEVLLILNIGVSHMNSGPSWRGGAVDDGDGGRRLQRWPSVSQSAPPVTTRTFMGSTAPSATARHRPSP